jgi:hypothetical protein
MKRLILVFFLIGITAIYFSCSDNIPSAPQLNQSDQVTNTLDKKPAANLIGIVATTLVYDPSSGSDVSWIGTIDFEGHPIYQIIFHAGEGTEFRGKSFHYVESWEIFNSSGVLLLAGSDEGIEPPLNINKEAQKFMSNGVVEVANVPFEMWLGRNAHQDGVVTSDETGTYANGILRIN